MQMADRSGAGDARPAANGGRLPGSETITGSPCLRDPAGDAFAHADPQVAIAGRFAGRDRVVEILLLLIDDQQRPGFRLEELLHLLHDGAQDRVQVERGGQCTRDIVKDLQVFGQGRTLWEGTIDHF